MAPSEDPRFTKISGQVHHVAADEKHHPPAKAKVAEAQGAAVGPPNEVAAQAGEAQVDKMAGAKPGTFDKAAFIAAVRTAIDAAAPRNLDEADNLKNSGKAAQVKDQVGGMVTKGKEETAKDVKGSTEAAPDTSQAKPKAVTPMGPENPGPPPPAVTGADAMPARRGPEETNLAAGPCAIKAKMDDAKVTDEQLAKGNEPQFNQTLESKKQLEEHAAKAPAEVKADEVKHLEAAKGGAGAAVQTGLTGMHAGRTGALGHVGGHKDKTKADDEAARAKVASDIDAIFKKTQTAVTKTLAELDTKVSDAFNAGEKTARDAFDQNVGKDMAAWKDKRYSGLSGAAQWVADKFSGPPPEVNQIFARNRAAYVAQMDKIISNVADLVGQELGNAKRLIADGRAEVKKYVASQPGALKKVAAEAEQKVSEQFDSLDNDVTSKQDSVVHDLAEKYAAARQSVDEAITKMQEENKGLVQQAEEAAEGAVDTVMKMKDMLLNVLARAANAIDRIIADPIGFLGKLVSAVKDGLSKFMSNIGTHLKKGLLGWLFGALAEGGITLPESFDLKGILNLVLSILGLTWANIRSRIVAQVGEPVMAKMEQVVDVFKIIATEGLGGLWKWILEKIGDFKEMIMGQIKDFVQEKVIIAGITWLIGLLNPAAAFIKACKAIYDVVMFFVEKGAQIKEFVDSILDSIESILSGGVGAVASLIENTLAKIIPLAISFLASLLGLGGIGEKIRSIIEKIQAPVNKAIDGVIGGALKVGKKLVGKMKGIGAKAKGKLLGGDDSPEGKQRRLDKGLAAGQSAANRFAGKPVGEAVLKPLLGAIRLRYGLSRLEPVEDGATWAVLGEINPRGQRPSNAKRANPRDAAEKALQGHGLSPPAVDRVFGKAPRAEQIKGQILEELVSISKIAAAPPVGPGGAPRREFIEGHRVKDTSRKQLTDGIDAMLGTDPKLGRIVRVFKIFEAKGSERSKYKLMSDSSRWSRASIESKEHLRRVAIGALSRELGLPPSVVAETQKKIVEDRMKTLYRQAEPGQAREDIERLSPDVDDAGRDMPATILIDDKRTSVVQFSPSRTEIVGVLPKGITPPSAAAGVPDSPLRVKYEHAAIAESDLISIAAMVQKAARAKK